MTKKQAELELRILTKPLNHNDWDYSEDNECRQWFGINYLGHGFVRCDFCKENAVSFKGYMSNHVCSDCQDSLRNL